MKAEGPRHERETVIRFDEESDSAEVWTASATVYRRLLKRLGRATLTEYGLRHAVFVFPKKDVILPRTKTKRAGVKGVGPGKSKESSKPAILGGSGI